MDAAGQNTANVTYFYMSDLAHGDATSFLMFRQRPTASFGNERRRWRYRLASAQTEAGPHKAP